MKIPDAKKPQCTEWEKLKHQKRNIVHLATLMDIRHLKNRELEPMHQSTRDEWCSKETS